MPVIHSRPLEEYSVPAVLPEPAFTEHCQTPVLSLNKVWKVTDGKHSREVQIPFDMTTLFPDGFARIYDLTFETELPPHGRNCRVFLVFEGVNGFADVYVNGFAAAHHENGMLTWQTDITGYIDGSREVSIKVHVDETRDEVSSFNHGGILRPAWIMIVPAAYLSYCRMTPLLDEPYEDCLLNIRAGMGGELSGSLRFHVIAPSGREIACREVPAAAEFTEQIRIHKPILWDAEHPHMYRIVAEVLRNGEVTERCEEETGLRRVERRGNRLYINGRAVKLRGSCRHEITALHGRATTHALIEEDVRLFREANINYIRTSHYPPNRYLLKMCDKYGIYVEDELALAFIARTLPYTQEDPKLTDRYISHFLECYARDASHPCVIIWSLCNESFGGYNFDRLNRFVHRMDPGRVTKFSYPMTIREECERPDIWSIHYSEYDADLGEKRDNLSVGGSFGRDMPVIHDEYCHIPCYDREELRRDPYLRSYWGQGLARMWDKIWNTDGALGGAIWAGIDDTDIYVGGDSRLEWGFLDVWRRKKPEFYMVRKAYTPVKVLQMSPEELVLENRFCHTDFNEIRAEWDCRGAVIRQPLPPAAPGTVLRVRVPFSDRERGGNPISVHFFAADGSCVEEDLIPAAGVSAPNLRLERRDKSSPGEADAGKSAGQNGSIQVTAREDGLELMNQAFCAEFGEDGLLREMKNAEGTVILGHGPWMNMPYFHLGRWKKENVTWERRNQQIAVTTEGEYENSVSLQWSFVFSLDGTLRVGYRIGQLTGELPHQMKLRVGVDNGGLDEMGFGFDAAPGMDAAEFALRYQGASGRYNTAPAGTMTSNPQTVYLSKDPQYMHEFGERPRCSFEEDLQDDILNGRYDPVYRGSNLFRATKEDVSRALFFKNGSRHGLAFIGGNCCNIRMEVADPEELKIENQDDRVHYEGTWYTVDDYHGPDHDSETLSHEKGASFELQFDGTGIVWYASEDTTYGCARVSLDGKIACENLSLRIPGVDFPGSAQGFDKRYRIPVWSVHGMRYGRHTLRVEVLGEKGSESQDSYVALDYLRVLDERRPERFRILMNQDFSFPHIAWGNPRKGPIIPAPGDEGYTVLRPAVISTGAGGAESQNPLHEPCGLI